MYTRSNSQNDDNIVRYTRTSSWATRFHSNRRSNNKRINPLYTESEKAFLAPQKKKSSSINAVFLQKAFAHIMDLKSQKEQEEVSASIQEPDSPSTPELSIHESNSMSPGSSLSASSSSSSFIKQEDGDLDSVDIQQAMRSLMEDEENESTDEEDDMAHFMPQGKKSVTCPDLSGMTNTDFEKRPLPPLPSIEDPDVNTSFGSLELCSRTSYLKKQTTVKMTRAATKGQVHLKRAATWLGLAGQKFLASPQVQNIGHLVSQKYHSASENMLLRLASNHNNFPAVPSSHSCISNQQEEETSKKLRLSEEVVYGTDSDHFAYLRNQLEQKHSSAKKTNNTANKKTFVTPKRIMYCRVMQIINLASTRDCDYELSVQLNSVTMASKRGVLRKAEKTVSADRPYDEALIFEVEEPFSLNFVVAARHTNTIVRDGLAKMGLLKPMDRPRSDKLLPVVGYTCLNFENKMDVLDQGVSRFRLTKPANKPWNRWLNIELLIDIKVEEVLPAVVHRFPWSYTTNECSAASYESIEDIVSDPKELLVSQTHCRQGDYLTVYTRGLAHPTWKRYWVTMEENQLLLHDFTYKDAKEPLSIIPLSPLILVGKPSLDDCENVGIARKTGIMLQFERSSAMLTEPVRLDSDEGLDGKAYLYGDSEQNTIHWRRAISAYVSSESRQPAMKEGVDLRFLW